MKGLGSGTRNGAVRAIAAGVAAFAAAVCLASAAPLTLREAVRTAVDHNPETRGSQARIDEQDQTLSLAYSKIFPQVSANLTGAYRKDAANRSSALFGGEPYNNYGFGLTLQQPLFVGGAISGGIAYAETSKTIAQRDDEITRRDLTRDVMEAFYSVLLYRRKADTLRRSHAVQEELLKTTEKRLRIGRSQPLDVLQVKTQLALLEPKIAAAGEAVQVSAARLSTLLGQEDAREIEVSGTLAAADWRTIQPKLKSDPAAVPELDRAEKQIDLVQAERKVTLAQDWPQLGLTGTWGRATFDKNELFSDNSTAWSLGLELSIPIFSGLSSWRERAILSTRESEAELGREGVRNTVALDRVRALKDVETSDGVISSAKAALDLGEESLKEAKKEYGLSAIDVTQYLASEQSLIEAELTYDQARFDYLIDLAHYCAAWGYPLQDLADLLDTKGEK